MIQKPRLRIRVTIRYVKELVGGCLPIISLLIFWLSLSTANAVDPPSDLKDLIRAVESGSELDCQQALIEIARMGSDASPAVASICGVLKSQNFSVRVLAVNALVAIGQPSVDPLRQLLESESSVARAASLQALGRLKAIVVNDVAGLVSDSDPRVRAGLAIALSDCEQAEIFEVLIELLSDAEPAVAIQACHALKKRRSNPELVVPKLIEALSRKKIATIVTETLSAYGTDAQSAIPRLLEVSTEIRRDLYSWPDPIESALEHIGPPSLADLDELCRLLGSGDHERTTLVATSLSHLGVQAERCSGDLEAAVDRWVRYSVETSRKFADADDEERHLHDDSVEATTAAESCALAYWAVTHNADRFVELVEKIARECEYPVLFSPRSLWDEFSESDIESLELLVSSEIPRVLESAYSAIEQIGPRSNRFANQVIESLDKNAYTAWMRPEMALAAMGPKMAGKTVPALVKSFKSGHTELRVLANAIEEIGIGSDECESILQDGLQDADQWSVAPCAIALCRTNTDPEKTATSILRAVEKSRCTSRQAIKAFRTLPVIPQSVHDFLIVSLSDEDAWTRHFAVIALGEQGPISKDAIDDIEPLLKMSHLDGRFEAAKTMYLITGNVDAFDRFLTSELENENKHAWRLSNVVEAIGSLGDRGASFLHHILANRKSLEANQVVELCKALQSVGNEDSIALLTEISHSTDWIAKTAAVEAIDVINNHQPKESP